MFQRASAFLFLLIIFVVLYIPACGDEDFAPAVDNLDVVDILDIVKEFENEMDTIDNIETPKEVSDDLCGEHNSLPMNCCLGDYTGGCLPTELDCGFVRIDQQCQMVCGGTILYMHFENNVPRWSNIPERYDWGLQLPLPIPIPIPGYPPPLNTPIFCDPW